MNTYDVLHFANIFIAHNNKFMSIGCKSKSFVELEEVNYTTT